MEYQTYISKCCNAPATEIEEGYLCEQCGEECSIKEPDTEPKE